MIKTQKLVELLKMKSISALAKTIAVLSITKEGIKGNLKESPEEIQKAIDELAIAGLIKRDKKSVKTHNIKETKDKAFDEIWDLYNYKKGRKPARKAFDRIPLKHYDIIKAHIPEYDRELKKPGAPARLHLATYLNQERYFDEFESTLDKNVKVSLYSEENKTIQL